MIQTLQPSQPFRPPDFTTKRHWEISDPNVRFSPRSPKWWINTTNSQLIKWFGPVDFSVFRIPPQVSDHSRKAPVKRRRTERPLRNQNFMLAMLFLCGCFGICDCSLLVGSWEHLPNNKTPGVSLRLAKFGDGPFVKFCFCSLSFVWSFPCFSKTHS